MSIPYVYPLPDQDYDILVVSYTYNHEKYIEQTLKGIVMQQTSCKFVALILDDCSTDGTADIIRAYEAKYPDLIKGIYEPENYFSQGKSQEEHIQPWRDRAKYQAFCEGDDYWIDPLKLQKQYDFMESHPDCTLSFHNVIEHWEDGRAEDKVFSNVEDRKYSADQILDGWIISTGSTMFATRISHSEKVIEIFTKGGFMFYDGVFCYSCAIEGELWGLSDVMGVYRRASSGYTLQMNEKLKQSMETIKSYLSHLLSVSNVFGPLLGEKFKKKADEIYLLNVCSVSLKLLRNLQIKNSLGLLYRALSYSFFGTIKVVVEQLVKRIRK